MTGRTFQIGLRALKICGMQIMVLCGIIICASGLLCGQGQSKDQQPLGRVELMAHLAFPGPTDRLQKLIEERGIAFQPTETDLSSFKSAGADDALTSAIRKGAAAKAPPPARSPSGEASAASTSWQSTKEMDEFQHLASAAELRQKINWDQAAEEFRAALKDDPDNALIHLDLASALRRSPNASEDAGIPELREALRLQPTLAEAHYELGIVLRLERDLQGAISEYRQTVRLEPDNEAARIQLASALEATHDLQGAVSVYGDGARLEPSNWLFHFFLGGALELSNDHDAAIAEEREAIRLKPDEPGPHFALARMLREEMDDQRADRETELGRELQGKQTGLRRIRLGGQVMAAKLIFRPQPEYPKKAKNKHIQGTVKLLAVIGKDGLVQEVKVLSGDPLLVEAATTAVERWGYEPTLLNGEPLEVVTEININFNLNLR